MLVLCWAIPSATRAELPQTLPESHPCSALEIRKTWKVIKVWESPEGTYLREYYAYPQQFLSFIDNQNYLTLIRASKVGNPAQLQQIMERARGNTTLQYLLNDKGALYLYRNKNVMVSAYCNIVIKPHGIFQPGMMWTYQSMTAPDIKLIKLYVPVRRAMPGILGTLKGTPPPQPLR